MKTADRNYLDYFLCMFILHLCPGGFVVKDGKLEFIGVKKSAGDWVHSTLEMKLPMRKGCKIQQHHSRSR